MKYDFDEYVSREKTDSLTVDGWREYLFSGQSEFAMRYPAEGLIVTARNQRNFRLRLSDNENPHRLTLSDNELAFIFFGSHSISFGSQ